VRVPDEAGDGKVQVKVSFPALKALTAAATTAELRIETPAAEPAADEPIAPAK
jgi:hypothetical protein